MNLDSLDREKIKKIRVGIFLFPALLKRFGNLEIPYPGGCNIGKRPIDEHLHAFAAFGYQDQGHDEILRFTGALHDRDITLSANFAVTATENMIMMAAFRRGKTTIEMAAIEPHVMNLTQSLQSI